MALEFAVFDAETTGFFPEKDDRLVELAVLRLDSRGKILRTFHSVINPDRPLPPSRTHSLNAEDLEQAPHFKDIAGDVVDILAEAVLISHNVIFNRLFIKEEFKRLGYKLPALPSICTLELARQLVPEPKSRKLPDVCRELGLTYGAKRNALEEARATRLVFLQALNQLHIKSIKDLGITESPPPKSAWPALPLSGKVSTRQEELPTVNPAPVTPEAATAQTLQKRASAFQTGKVAQDQYLILLDQILEDRVITKDETTAMKALVKEYNLGPEQVHRANKIYLKELFVAAWSDGKITSGEKQDLEEVRRLLGLSHQDYANLMVEAKQDAARKKEPAEFMSSKSKIQGKSVCFAGPPRCKVKGMIPSEMFAQSLASEAGLNVKPHLTRNLDFVIIPDREAQSDEVETAQEMGVRILAEPVFWRMIGIDIQ